MALDDMLLCQYPVLSVVSTDLPLAVCNRSLCSGTKVMRFSFTTTSP